MRVNKLCRYIIFILMLFLLLDTKSVYAGGIGGGTSANGSATSEGSVDANASASGYSKLRSGYLIYITDTSGNPVSQVLLVPYASRPASGVRLYLSTRVTGSPITGIYGGTIGQACNGTWSMPPIDTTTGVVYGESLKAWMLQANDAGDANVFTLIQNLYGEDMCVSFRDNDYYLCVEAVCWMGLRSSATPTLVAGTSKTLNEKFSTEGSTYMGYFRKCRFPHSGYLEHDWAGCTAMTVHSGTTESMADLTAVGNGYGMIMCRSSEITGTIPDPPPDTEIVTSDYLTANELNYAFPDFLVGTSLGRSYESYEAKINMGDESVWKHHGGTLKDDKWYITETIVSDLVNFYGASNCLLYRPSASTYAKPSAMKEFWRNLLETEVK